MGDGWFGRLFCRALVAVGGALLVFGLTRGNPPFLIRAITVSGIFAMLIGSAILTELNWLRRAEEKCASDQILGQEEAEEPSSPE
jgi:hypothetical protein